MAPSLTTSKCQNCGARIERGGGFCTFCGAELPAATVTVVPPAAPTKSQRFRDLVAHPAYAGLLAHRPSTAGLMRVGAYHFFGGLFMLAALGFITIVFLSTKPGMAFFPLAMGVLVLIRLVKRMSRASAAASESLRSVPALIVEKTQMPPRQAAGDALANRVLLENVDGTRADLEVPDAVAGKLAAGDFGVAYVAAGYLVDFARLEV